MASTSDGTSYLRAVGDELEVVIVPEGLPRFKAVCPAPMLKDVDRVDRHEGARRGIVLDGYHIVSERLVRNEAFDKEDETTTLELVYRPCKDADEAQAVLERAALYLRQLAAEIGHDVPSPSLEPRRLSPLGEDSGLAGEG